MKNKRILMIFSFLLYAFVYTGSLSAGQIRSMELSPASQMLQQSPAILNQQPVQPARAAPAQQLQLSRQLSVETLSEFEQYISKKIDITEKQLEILEKYRITFSQSIQPPPFGKIKIAVRIIKSPESKKETGEFNGIPMVVDAGFLTGTRVEFSMAFEILGIKDPFILISGIEQFGYDLFSQPPSIFAPVENVPVGPDYIFGPGDEIRITVWGKIQGEWNIAVDREGFISLPGIGILGVAGLTFRELKEVVFKEFSKYYTGFEMNVSMGALRTIRVYVVGNVQSPGAYTVSSLSTILNALFAAGGPSKVGTMRAIQLKRNGKTIVNFDMYDFLLRGDKTTDMRLMPEDVIFIPPIGALVGIAGSVNSPAIYELKGETEFLQLDRLIEMAGGLSVVAFKGRVQIERIIDNSLQRVFESNLAEVSIGDIKVQSGDIVKIFQVVQDKKVVRLVGAVMREGEYGFSIGMTVKDLVVMAGGLRYYAYDKEAELTRIHVTDKGQITEKILIDLEKALAEDPHGNMLLMKNDYLFIRTIPEWRLYQIVTISGEVRFPGTYTIKKGERLSSLIERAGGFTDKAYLRGAVFAREKVRELQQERIDEMIDRLERAIMSTSAAQVATAATTGEAKLMQIETRQKKQFIEKLRTATAEGRITIRLESPDKLKETPYDIELEAGDSLYTPTDPNTVQIIGSIYNQTAFIYEERRNVQHYINLAGGYTENANDDDVYILKSNGTAVKADGGFLGLSWNSEYGRWEAGGEQVESGDTIVVPEKLERIAWMRYVKDITQILYQIAVTAGVVIAAFP